MARVREPLTVYAKKVPFTKDTWELTEDLEFHVGSPDSDEVLIARKGFRTDFSSTPWGVRNMFPKDDVDSAAAVFHDMLYKNKGVLPVENFTGPAKIYSQKDCDGIYLEIMGVCGQTFWKKRIKYRMLRMFGTFSWNKKTNVPGRAV